LVLVKQVFKNEDGSEGVLYPVSKDRLGMEVFRPRLGVMIGTNREFRDAVQRQKLASRYPDLEVVTYDDVLSHAQRRMALIRGAQR
jgi:hypothetical protein